MHRIAFPHKPCFLPPFTGFSLIGHLDLHSELDFGMDLPNLDKPTFLSTATSAPVATSSHCSLSAPTTQHTALDSSLLLLFPQKGHAEGQVRAYRGRGGDLCALAGGALEPDTRVETTAS
jgi:hypothetical protein